jgi:hypothetical protein
MVLSILGGIVAVLLWCVTDTGLKPEHLCNSKGEITFWRTLSMVLVQILLWTGVFFLTLSIVPHLPDFLITEWRLPLTFFVAVICRWFALLMLLQYVWLLLRSSARTALYAASSSVRQRETIRSLETMVSKTAEREKKTSTQHGNTGS